MTVKTGVLDHRATTGGGGIIPNGSNGTVAVRNFMAKD